MVQVFTIYCPVTICRQTANRAEGFCGMLSRLILLTHVRKKWRWSFFIKTVKCDRGGEGVLWCCRNAGNGSTNIRMYPRTPSHLNIPIFHPDLQLDLWVCHIRVFSDVSRPHCIPSDAAQIRWIPQSCSPNCTLQRFLSTERRKTAQFERVLIKITFFNVLVNSKQNL